MSVKRLIVVAALLFSFLGAAAAPALADVFIIEKGTGALCGVIPKDGPHVGVFVTQC